DAEKGTLRVMVAANRAVETDRIRSAGDGSAVMAEAGLDKSLFETYGAKVVRAVDNLVTFDVPLAQAMSMGLALAAAGLESRPARLFKAAMGAMASPVGTFLGAQFLPIPSEGTAAALAALPKLVEARDLVEGQALERAGMRGQGSLVGIIDSGIDPDHADFKDAEGNSRISDYLDFTGEGKDDVVGHGTHVAGTIGGSGAASQGAYRGLADQTKFKVAKVFGTKGETDESVLLAAMKWMAGGGDMGAKVDLLNMSLGGPGDPNVDPLSSMANRLTVNDKILVVAAAGNEGPWTSSVGSPGNARYALTVGGVNKDGEVAFFSSRGPIVDSQNRVLYGKPDVMGVSGDVDLSRVQPAPLVADSGERPAPHAGLASLAAAPAQQSCIYAPGVIAPRSSHDPDQACVVAGNAGYRYMSGTSMATPEVAGMAADVIAYLKAQGYEVDPFQVKAVIMETAGTLVKEPKDVQGAGLVNGTRLVQAVVDRVKRGLPVGNVAFALSMRLTTKDRESLSRQNRYQLTPLGLLDTTSGRLVRDEAEIHSALQAIRSVPPTQTVSLPSVEILPG
ncbi:MAG: peptidase, partial [Elusimicrobia bacterium]